MIPSPDLAGPKPPARPLRVAAVGDLHVMASHVAPYREMFVQIGREADVLCLCGDLTNQGRLDEAHILAEDLRACPIPVVAVLGNHDYECGHADEVTRILREAGAKVLDGEAVEIGGVGFAGAKGFVGGFGRHMLSSFGEAPIKTFVQASVDETLKLETALRTLRTDRTVVVLHYAPIPETLVGEPEQIFCFLGSSRLAETIDRFEGVRAVMHGHAHRGSPMGHTPRGVPVRNVAQMVNREAHGRPWLVFEV